MASTIGKVRAVFTASSSGLTAGVNQASASMKRLGGDSRALGQALRSLESLTGAGVSGLASSLSATGPAAAAAAAAIAMISSSAASLESQLQAGKISNDQFLASMHALTAEANQSAAIFQRGASVFASTRTAQETYSSSISELDTLLRAGAIDQETYSRAVNAATETLNNATGVTQAARDAMNELADAHRRGAQVTESVATAEERHAAEIGNLRGLLAAGAISQQTYARAVDRANDTLARSRSSASSFVAGASSVSSAVSAVTNRLNVLIAINGAQLFSRLASSAINAARSMVGMGAASAEAIGNQRDLAARLGLTYGELSGLTLAGEQVGVSMEAIGGAVTRAEVAFTKAASGSQTAVAAFQRIGLSVEELNGLSAAERFQSIAQAISELQTPAERSAAAVGLFGRAGAQLLPMFEMGAAGIRAAMQEADSFGLALNSVQADNVDRMGDSFTKAQAAVKGVVDQVVAYLAPAVTRVTEAFTTLISGVGGQNIGAAIGEAILGGARYLAQVADFLIANVGPAFQYVSQVAGQWNAVWEFGGRVVSFFAGIGDSLQAAFGVLILGITGPVEGLIYAAQQIGNRLGFDTSGLDAALASMDAFNVTVADGITENINSAAQNFNNALAAEGNRTGEAIAGPVTQAFDEARAAARDALGQVDVAASQTVEIRNPDAVGQALGQSVKQALSGIDSRTTEGMKEYFRLVRGDTGGEIQEQQLRVMQQIEENTSGDPFEMDIFDLAPAAGG